MKSVIIINQKPIPMTARTANEYSPTENAQSNILFNITTLLDLTAYPLSIFSAKKIPTHTTPKKSQSIFKSKIQIDKLVIKKKQPIQLMSRNEGLDSTYTYTNTTTTANSYAYSSERNGYSKKIGYNRQNTEQISLPKIITAPQVFSGENCHDLSFGFRENGHEYSNSGINNQRGETGDLNLVRNSSVSKGIESYASSRNKDKDKEDKKKYFKIKTFTKERLKSDSLNRGSNGSNLLNFANGNNLLDLNTEMYQLTTANIGLAFSKYPKPLASSSTTGYIRAYAVNSFQGIIRSYNEDRVSIILTIVKPPNYSGIWPTCSFFAIYDGHGGNKCCDFLRDKLQDYIIKNEFFPRNPQVALISGIEEAEKDFINTQALNPNGFLLDKSGSCALVALIVDNICYVANVGDSRMIISKNKGKVISTITTDHKPNEEKESRRIISNGGKIYQTNSPKKPSSFQRKIDTSNINNSNISYVQDKQSPHRVIPGRLAVSRTIGDIEAKIPDFGGNPNVVIATPEITQFNIDEDIDFFFMGCDGIFDSLSNEECIECAWTTLRSKKYNHSLHSKAGAVVDMIIKSSLKRRSGDNVTGLFVAFAPFERAFDRRNQKSLHLSSNFNLIKANIIEERDVKEEDMIVPRSDTTKGLKLKLKKCITLAL